MRIQTIISFALLLCLSSCGDYVGKDLILNKEQARDTIFVVDTVFLERPIANNPRQHFLDTMKHYIGRREENLSNRGPEIDQFFNGCSVGPGNPWCACVMNYGVEAVGYEGPEELSAWSPAWFPYDKVTWDATKNFNQPLRPADMFAIYFKTLGRIGHVGAVVEELPNNWVMTIEGNTNEKGGRDGYIFIYRLRRKEEIYQASDWF
jgi:hypothetical protein